MVTATGQKINKPILLSSLESKPLFDKNDADYIFRDKVDIKQSLFTKKFYSQFIKLKTLENRYQ